MEYTSNCNENRVTRSIGAARFFGVMSQHAGRRIYVCLVHDVTNDSSGQNRNVKTIRRFENVVMTSRRFAKIHATTTDPRTNNHNQQHQKKQTPQQSNYNNVNGTRT